MTAPHINQLRAHLLATLADLRNRTEPMEPDRARAVAQVASVLVDTAKVEVDYLRATGQDHCLFLEGVDGNDAIPAISNGPTAHNPFPTSVIHRLGE